jgi:hypothetical protein
MTSKQHRAKEKKGVKSEQVHSQREEARSRPRSRAAAAAPPPPAPTPESEVSGGKSADCSAGGEVVWL